MIRVPKPLSIFFALATALIGFIFVVAFVMVFLVVQTTGLISKADEFFSSFSDGSILLSDFVSFPQVLAFSAVVAILNLVVITVLGAVVAGVAGEIGEAGELVAHVAPLHWIGRVTLGRFDLRCDGRSAAEIGVDVASSFHGGVVAGVLNCAFAVRAARVSKPRSAP